MQKGAILIILLQKMKNFAEKKLKIERQKIQKNLMC